MKRATYEQEQNNYRLQDGIGFLHPFEDAINLLGQYEDLFAELIEKRVFWIIHYIWEVPSAIPITVIGVNNRYLDVKWQITDEYEEKIEEVDITELYNTQEEAERVIKAMKQEAGQKEVEEDGEV